MSAFHRANDIDSSFDRIDTDPIVEFHVELSVTTEILGPLAIISVQHILLAGGGGCILALSGRTLKLRE